MCVGTVQANWPDLPKDFMNQPVRASEINFKRTNQVLVLKWTWEINILKTKHLPTVSDHTTRTEKKYKSDSVINYTKIMPGFDLNDQIITYNPFHRKTVKCLKKLAFHHITLCVVQAHILHKRVEKQRQRKVMGIEQFMCQLCKALSQERRALASAEGEVAPHVEQFVDDIS
ncbi:hypothetical protein RRG08_038744 [Elysia crispata]|uniref:PiggyBac transposable element-derived protein domain-containing protein n=1 Tax=Elysia crispata TaxID=231223 RepID=A0AAE1CPT8_9GAST|nr:hypothetical protein RRG08_038744 [Elysia crispata]